MKDRGSRFHLFFVYQEQLYPRCKLSELINTERLFNGSHRCPPCFRDHLRQKAGVLLVRDLAPGQGNTHNLSGFFQRASFNN